MHIIFILGYTLHYSEKRKGHTFQPGRGVVICWMNICLHNMFIISLRSPQLFPYSFFLWEMVVIQMGFHLTCYSFEWKELSFIWSHCNLTGIPDNRWANYTTAKFRYCGVMTPCRWVPASVKNILPLPCRVEVQASTLKMELLVST